MENINNTSILDRNNDEIDFRELFDILWNGKWLIIFVTSFFSITAVIYSLALPNIYQSSSILNPVTAKSDASQALGNLGGMASFAGINLSSQSGDSNSVKAIKKLRTLSFFENNILPNIFLPNLLAVESWDPVSNNIVYKKDIYNEAQSSWVRNVEYPQNKTPSAQEAFAVFNSEHIQVSTDKDTGFVVLSVRHQSPYIAKAWTDLIVKQLNNFFRTKDKTEAQAAVTFLSSQIALTNFAEIKQVIAQLLQQKTQQLTLIEVSDFYVFEYLDPPAVMERKSEPRRSLICLLGAFLGGCFSILFVVIRHYAFNDKSL
ncbi:Wzz/FepE/Etk N-terminal domain-containing protein [Gammaproteobacteria bacterium]|nr:Wzz/FepE/Etk N-terminal domain-containing protein [Gammaproteobacteria bacterium]